MSMSAMLAVTEISRLIRNNGVEKDKNEVDIILHCVAAKPDQKPNNKTLQPFKNTLA